MSVKLESSAKLAVFRPNHLEDGEQYAVVDLETQNSAIAFGKDLNSEFLSELAGNKNSWIVQIRPTQARF